MRFYLIWLVFIFVSFFAWKDWFKALCFLVVSMAILERPDFPESALGIPGLDPWNLLFLNVVLAFFLNYKKPYNDLNLPGKTKFFINYYLFFIVLAFFREIGDLSGVHAYADYMGASPISTKDVIVDDLFNTIKYAVPGLLFFYGIGLQKEKSIYYGLAAICLLSFLLAALVVKVMPIGALTDGYTLEQTGIRKIDRDIGYYRSDLAILFAAGSWAIFSFKELQTSKTLKLLCIGGSFIIALAMALTGGRIGMGAWFVVGGLLAYFRWRKLLFLAPIVVVIILTFVPAVQERFTQGLASDDEFAEQEPDVSSATSGRTVIWPYVIEEIGKAPWFGHGRRGMQRIGLSLWLQENINERFPHPHNAYLELLLDNGIILSLPILLFYLVLLKYSFSLFRDNRNRLYVLVGGTGLTYLVAHMVGFIGLQHFYPFTSSTSLWCAAGMVLRIYVERERIKDGNHELLFREQTIKPEVEKT